MRRYPIRRGLSALAVVVLLTLSGCGPDEAPARGFPAVVIEVGIVDSDAPAVPLAVPDAWPPARAADGRRTWLLAPLLKGARGNLAAFVEVEDTQGRWTELTEPLREGGGLVWALEVAGEEPARVLRVQPDGSPAPSEDQARAVADVVRVRMRVDPRVSTGSTAAVPDAAAQREALGTLAIAVDGQATDVDPQRLATLSPLAIHGDDGGRTRDAWDARALARAMAGPTARIVRVRGDGGRQLELAPAGWNDDARTPVLRLNRRGRWKFHWIDGASRPLDGATLRNLTGIEIVKD